MLHCDLIVGLIRVLIGLERVALRSYYAVIMYLYSCLWLACKQLESAPLPSLGLSGSMLQLQQPSLFLHLRRNL